MAYKRRGNVVPGQFGRRSPHRPATSSTDWLSPDAYNALSRDEKMALAQRRQMRANQSPKAPGKTWKRRRSRRLPWWQYQGLVALSAIAAIVVVGSTDSLFSKQSVATPTGAMEVRASFGLCHTGGGRNCVVDGDTIWLEGVKIR